MCVASQIHTGPVKMDVHKHNGHEDIKNKMGIFHILNGILAKARNLISLKRSPGRIMDS